MRENRIQISYHERGGFFNRARPFCLFSFEIRKGVLYYENNRCTAERKIGMTADCLKELVRQKALELLPRLEKINEEIFAHPELGLKEEYAARLLTEEAKSFGFTVEKPYAGFDTAFRAVCGEKGPTVAFLAEYDALPGYGPERLPAHACGHSWIAAASLGAAAVLASLREHFSGTVVLYGTPAEETVGAKADLAREGCFRGIDAAFQMHLSGERTALLPCALALDPIEITFFGKAAHAASAPHEGINALDACNLTFCGVNALRQHVRQDVRMHGVITEGGAAPNIVPDRCAMRWYLRALDREYLDTVREKFLNCARGAALMTGAKMEWRKFENSFDELKNDEGLLQKMEKNLRILGENDLDLSVPPPFGSTDLGNVSHVCPTMYVSLWAGNNDGADIHSERFLRHVTGDRAASRLLLAVQAMAMTAADVLCGE